MNFLWHSNTSYRFVRWVFLLIISAISFSICLMSLSVTDMLKFLAKAFFFLAFSIHSGFGHKYAPRPFALPLRSIRTESSSNTTIRIRSFFGLDSIHPIHRLVGILFCLIGIILFLYYVVFNDFGNIFNVIV